MYAFFMKVNWKDLDKEEMKVYRRLKRERTKLWGQAGGAQGRFMFGKDDSLATLVRVRRLNPNFAIGNPNEIRTDLLTVWGIAYGNWFGWPMDMLSVLDSAEVVDALKASRALHNQRINAVAAPAVAAPSVAAEQDRPAQPPPCIVLLESSASSGSDWSEDAAAPAAAEQDE